MIQTTKCVVCFGKPRFFGGHVHKGDDHIIAGTCEEHNKSKDHLKEGCKGCYGEWKEEMGLVDHNFSIDNTYGTYKSKLLKEIIRAGFNPIGITVMICEETFIFTTDAEADEASKKFMPEGWWYGLDGKYTWEETRKQYVNDHYKGNEAEAPTVYWLNDLPIHCLAWDIKNGGYYKITSPWKDDDLKEIGFDVKQRYNTEEEAMKCREIAEWNLKYKNKSI